MKNRKQFWGPFLFGVGIIAMIDGIIFHQLLQWHSVYMDTDRPHQIMSDGLFHLFSLIILFIGGIMLWNRGELNGRRPQHIFWGAFLLGAGWFNFVEGIVNHHLLQIHHVNPASPNRLFFDLAYDASGLLIIVIGWLIYRKGKKM
ncbi:hypothetical protein ACH95_13530 [Bacillus glycinifermentans]|uniref:DUF2243 domain-containing protein n=2 Tax=Bacillus TaxID=1386 RepID=A0A0J6EHV1_9BACI|nr:MULTISPECIES: DUF2243 domain-containing protein [Bacillus]ATH91550.1 DUF2243 domain-containing protein [Bacillus glycinifermentans]KKB71661.1 hypothetical protein TH62_20965 [Bacillus sp. TH008]KMM58493.1 hypothetical protein ACH95_13530 [Bacillus glycinifermentans]KRT93976.1 hypothetical protein AB447_216700 [Bacillus glycinifermentans]MDU0069736.1 DUF2243 domain-containing protein [Bacillus sp. IG6]